MPDPTTPKPAAAAATPPAKPQVATPATPKAHPVGSTLNFAKGYLSNPNYDEEAENELADLYQHSRRTAQKVVLPKREEVDKMMRENMGADYKAGYADQTYNKMARQYERFEKGRFNALRTSYQGTPDTDYNVMRGNVTSKEAIDNSGTDPYAQRMGLKSRTGAVQYFGQSPEQMVAENFDRARDEETAMAKFGQFERTQAETQLAKEKSKANKYTLVGQYNEKTGNVEPMRDGQGRPMLSNAPIDPKGFGYVSTLDDNGEPILMQVQRTDLKLNRSPLVNVNDMLGRPEEDAIAKAVFGGSNWLGGNINESMLRGNSRYDIESSNGGVVRSANNYLGYIGAGASRTAGYVAGQLDHLGKDSSVRGGLNRLAGLGGYEFKPGEYEKDMQLQANNGLGALNLDMRGSAFSSLPSFINGVSQLSAQLTTQTAFGIFGGGAGLAVTALDATASSYYEARKNGLTETESNVFGAIVGGLTFGTGKLVQGMAISKLASIIRKGGQSEFNALVRTEVSGLARSLAAEAEAKGMSLTTQEIAASVETATPYIVQKLNLGIGKLYDKWEGGVVRSALGKAAKGAVGAADDIAGRVQNVGSSKSGALLLGMGEEAVDEMVDTGHEELTKKAMRGYLLGTEEDRPEWVKKSLHDGSSAFAWKSVGDILEGAVEAGVLGAIGGGMTSAPMASVLAHDNRRRVADLERLASMGQTEAFSKYLVENDFSTKSVQKIQDELSAWRDQGKLGTHLRPDGSVTDEKNESENEIMYRSLSQKVTSLAELATKTDLLRHAKGEGKGALVEQLNTALGQVKSDDQSFSHYARVKEGMSQLLTLTQARKDVTDIAQEAAVAVQRAINPMVAESAGTPGEASTGQHITAAAAPDANGDGIVAPAFDAEGGAFGGADPDEVGEPAKPDATKKGGTDEKKGTDKTGKTPATPGAAGAEAAAPSATGKDTPALVDGRKKIEELTKELGPSGGVVLQYSENLKEQLDVKTALLNTEPEQVEKRAELRRNLADLQKKQDKLENEMTTLSGQEPAVGSLRKLADAQYLVEHAAAKQQELFNGTTTSYQVQEGTIRLQQAAFQRAADKPNKKATRRQIVAMQRAVSALSAAATNPATGILDAAYLRRQLMENEEYVARRRFSPLAADQVTKVQQAQAGALGVDALTAALQGNDPEAIETAIAALEMAAPNGQKISVLDADQAPEAAALMQRHQKTDQRSEHDARTNAQDTPALGVQPPATPATRTAAQVKQQQTAGLDQVAATADQATAEIEEAAAELEAETELPKRDPQTGASTTDSQPAYPGLQPEQGPGTAPEVPQSMNRDREVAALATGSTTQNVKKVRVRQQAQARISAWESKAFQRVKLSATNALRVLMMAEKQIRQSWSPELESALSAATTNLDSFASRLSDYASQAREFAWKYVGVSETEALVAAMRKAKQPVIAAARAFARALRSLGEALRKQTATLREVATAGAALAQARMTQGVRVLLDQMRHLNYENLLKRLRPFTAAASTSMAALRRKLRRTATVLATAPAAGSPAPAAAGITAAPGQDSVLKVQALRDALAAWKERQQDHVRQQEEDTIENLETAMLHGQEDALRAALAFFGRDLPNGDLAQLQTEAAQLLQESEEEGVSSPAYDQVGKRVDELMKRLQDPEDLRSIQGSDPDEQAEIDYLTGRFGIPNELENTLNTLMSQARSTDAKTQSDFSGLKRTVITDLQQAALRNYGLVLFRQRVVPLLNAPGALAIKPGAMGLKELPESTAGQLGAINDRLHAKASILLSMYDALGSNRYRDDDEQQQLVLLSHYKRLSELLEAPALSAATPELNQMRDLTRTALAEMLTKLNAGTATMADLDVTEQPLRTVLRANPKLALAVLDGWLAPALQAGQTMQRVLKEFTDTKDGSEQSPLSHLSELLGARRGDIIAARQQMLIDERGAGTDGAAAATETHQLSLEQEYVLQAAMSFLTADSLPLADLIAKSPQLATVPASKSATGTIVTAAGSVFNITGKPGTGKTYLMQTLLPLAARLMGGNLDVLVSAPHAPQRARLSTVIGTPKGFTTTTVEPDEIIRLLSSGDTMKQRLIVIDEVTALGTDQAMRLLGAAEEYNATRPASERVKIVLLGDPLQLPGMNEETGKRSDAGHPLISQRIPMLRARPLRQIYRSGFVTLHTGLELMGERILSGIDNDSPAAHDASPVPGRTYSKTGNATTLQGWTYLDEAAQHIEIKDLVQALAAQGGLVDGKPATVRVLVSPGQEQTEIDKLKAAGLTENQAASIVFAANDPRLQLVLNYDQAQGGDFTYSYVNVSDEQYAANTLRALFVGASRAKQYTSVRLQAGESYDNNREMSTLAEYQPLSGAQIQARNEAVNAQLKAASSDLKPVQATTNGSTGPQADTTENGTPTEEKEEEAQPEEAAEEADSEADAEEEDEPTEEEEEALNEQKETEAPAGTTGQKAENEEPEDSEEARVLRQRVETVQQAAEILLFPEVNDRDEDLDSTDPGTGEDMQEPLSKAYDKRFGEVGNMLTRVQVLNDLPGLAALIGAPAAAALATTEQQLIERQREMQRSMRSAQANALTVMPGLVVGDLGEALREVLAPAEAAEVGLQIISEEGPDGQPIPLDVRLTLPVLDPKTGQATGKVSTTYFGAEKLAGMTQKEALRAVREYVMAKEALLDDILHNLTNQVATRAALQGRVVVHAYALPLAEGFSAPTPQQNQSKNGFIRKLFDVFRVAPRTSRGKFVNDLNPQALTAAMMKGLSSEQGGIFTDGGDFVLRYEPKYVHNYLGWEGEAPSHREMAETGRFIVEYVEGPNRLTIGAIRNDIATTPGRVRPVSNEPQRADTPLDTLLSRIAAGTDFGPEGLTLGKQVTVEGWRNSRRHHPRRFNFEYKNRYPFGQLRERLAAEGKGISSVYTFTTPSTKEVHLSSSAQLHKSDLSGRQFAFISHSPRSQSEIDSEIETAVADLIDQVSDGAYTSLGQLNPRELSLVMQGLLEQYDLQLTILSNVDMGLSHYGTGLRSTVDAKGVVKTYAAPTTPQALDALLSTVPGTNMGEILPRYNQTEDRSLPWNDGRNALVGSLFTAEQARSTTRNGRSKNDPTDADELRPGLLNTVRDALKNGGVFNLLPSNDPNSSDGAAVLSEAAKAVLTPAQQNHLIKLIQRHQTFWLPTLTKDGKKPSRVSAAYLQDLLLYMEYLDGKGLPVSQAWAEWQGDKGNQSLIQFNGYVPKDARKGGKAPLFVKTIFPPGLNPEEVLTAEYKASAEPSFQLNLSGVAEDLKAGTRASAPAIGQTPAPVPAKPKKPVPAALTTPSTPAPSAAPAAPSAGNTPDEMRAMLEEDFAAAAKYYQVEYLKGFVLGNVNGGDVVAGKEMTIISVEPALIRKAVVNFLARVGLPVSSIESDKTKGKEFKVNVTLTDGHVLSFGSIMGGAIAPANVFDRFESLHTLAAEIFNHYMEKQNQEALSNLSVFKPAPAVTTESSDAAIDAYVLGDEPENEVPYDDELEEDPTDGERVEEGAADDTGQQDKADEDAAEEESEEEIFEDNPDDSNPFYLRAGVVSNPEPAVPESVWGDLNYILGEDFPREQRTHIVDRKGIPQDFTRVLGRFFRGLVQLNEMPGGMLSRAAGRHEPLHAIMDMLTPERKAEVLAAGRALLLAEGLPGAATATNLEVEEYLADRFVRTWPEFEKDAASYRNSGIVKALQANAVGRTVLRFFEGIRSVYDRYLKRRSSVERLFAQAHRGYFLGSEMRLANAAGEQGPARFASAEMTSRKGAYEGLRAKVGAATMHSLERHVGNMAYGHYLFRFVPGRKPLNAHVALMSVRDNYLTKLKETYAAQAAGNTDIKEQISAKAITAARKDIGTAKFLTHKERTRRLALASLLAEKADESMAPGKTWMDVLLDHRYSFVDNGQSDAYSEAENTLEGGFQEREGHLLNKEREAMEGQMLLRQLETVPQLVFEKGMWKRATGNAMLAQLNTIRAVLHQAYNDAKEATPQAMPSYHDVAQALKALAVPQSEFGIAAASLLARFYNGLDKNGNPMIVLHDKAGKPDGTNPSFRQLALAGRYDPWAEHVSPVLSQLHGFFASVERREVGDADYDSLRRGSLEGQRNPVTKAYDQKKNIMESAMFLKAFSQQGGEYVPSQLQLDELGAAGLLLRVNGATVEVWHKDVTQPVLTITVGAETGEQVQHRGGFGFIADNTPLDQAIKHWQSMTPIVEKMVGILGLSAGFAPGLVRSLLTEYQASPQGRDFTDLGGARTNLGTALAKIMGQALTNHLANLTPESVKTLRWMTEGDAKLLTSVLVTDDLLDNTHNVNSFLSRKQHTQGDTNLLSPTVYWPIVRDLTKGLQRIAPDREKRNVYNEKNQKKATYRNTTAIYPVMRLLRALAKKALGTPLTPSLASLNYLRNEAGGYVSPLANGFWSLTGAREFNLWESRVGRKKKALVKASAQELHEYSFWGNFLGGLARGQNELAIFNTPRSDKPTQKDFLLKLGHAAVGPEYNNLAALVSMGADGSIQADEQTRNRVGLLQQSVRSKMTYDSYQRYTQALHSLENRRVMPYRTPAERRAQGTPEAQAAVAAMKVELRAMRQELTVRRDAVFAAVATGNDAKEIEALKLMEAQYNKVLAFLHAQDGGRGYWIQSVSLDQKVDVENRGDLAPVYASKVTKIAYQPKKQFIDEELESLAGEADEVISAGLHFMPEDLADKAYATLFGGEASEAATAMKGFKKNAKSEAYALRYQEDITPKPDPKAKPKKLKKGEVEPVVEKVMRDVYNPLLLSHLLTHRILTHHVEEALNGSHLYFKGHADAVKRGIARETPIELQDQENPGSLRGELGVIGVEDTRLGDLHDPALMAARYTARMRGPLGPDGKPGPDVEVPLRVADQSARQQAVLLLGLQALENEVGFEAAHAAPLAAIVAAGSKVLNGTQAQDGLSGMNMLQYRMQVRGEGGKYDGERALVKNIYTGRHHGSSVLIKTASLVYTNDLLALGNEYMQSQFINSMGGVQSSAFKAFTQARTELRAAAAAVEKKYQASKDEKDASGKPVKRGLNGTQWLEQQLKADADWDRTEEILAEMEKLPEHANWRRTISLNSYISSAKSGSLGAAAPLDQHAYFNRVMMQVTESGRILSMHADAANSTIARITQEEHIPALLGENFKNTAEVYGFLEELAKGGLLRLDKIIKKSNEEAVTQGLSSREAKRAYLYKQLETLMRTLDQRGTTLSAVEKNYDPNLTLLQQHIQTAIAGAVNSAVSKLRFKGVRASIVSSTGLVNMYVLSEHDTTTGAVFSQRRITRAELLAHRTSKGSKLADTTAHGDLRLYPMFNAGEGMSHAPFSVAVDELQFMHITDMSGERPRALSPEETVDVYRQLKRAEAGNAEAVAKLAAWGLGTDNPRYVIEPAEMMLPRDVLRPFLTERELAKFTAHDVQNLNAGYFARKQMRYLTGPKVSKQDTHLLEQLRSRVAGDEAAYQQQVAGLAAARGVEIHANLQQALTPKGTRIPVTNLNSLQVFKIAGFFDSHANTVLVPSELLTISGADNDGDQITLEYFDAEKMGLTNLSDGLPDVMPTPEETAALLGKKLTPATTSALADTAVAEIEAEEEAEANETPTTPVAVAEVEAEADGGTSQESGEVPGDQVLTEGLRKTIAGLRRSLFTTKKKVLANVLNVLDMFAPIDFSELVQFKKEAEAMIKAFDKQKRGTRADKRRSGYSKGAYELFSNIVLHLANQAGKTGVGPFVKARELADVIRMLQHANNGQPIPFAFPFVYLGKTTESLNTHWRQISQQLEKLANAALDNAKEGLLGYLNINEHTWSVYSAGIMGGMAFDELIPTLNHVFMRRMVDRVVDKNHIGNKYGTTLLKTLTYQLAGSYEPTEQEEADNKARKYEPAKQGWYEDVENVKRPSVLFQAVHDHQASLVQELDRYTREGYDEQAAWLLSYGFTKQNLRDNTVTRFTVAEVEGREVITVGVTELLNLGGAQEGTAEEKVRRYVLEQGFLLSQRGKEMREQIGLLSVLGGVPTNDYDSRKQADQVATALGVKPGAADLADVFKSVSEGVVPKSADKKKAYTFPVAAFLTGHNYLRAAIGGLGRDMELRSELLLRRMPELGQLLDAAVLSGYGYVRESQDTYNWSRTQVERLADMAYLREHPLEVPPALLTRYPALAAEFAAINRSASRGVGQHTIAGQEMLRRAIADVLHRLSAEPDSQDVLAGAGQSGVIAQLQFSADGRRLQPELRGGAELTSDQKTQLEAEAEALPLVTRKDPAAGEFVQQMLLYYQLAGGGLKLGRGQLTEILPASVLKPVSDHRDGLVENWRTAITEVLAAETAETASKKKGSVEEEAEVTESVELAELDEAPATEAEGEGQVEADPDADVSRPAQVSQAEGQRMKTIARLLRANGNEQVKLLAGLFDQYAMPLARPEWLPAMEWKARVLETPGSPETTVKYTKDRFAKRAADLPQTVEAHQLLLGVGGRWKSSAEAAARDASQVAEPLPRYVQARNGSSAGNHVYAAMEMRPDPKTGEPRLATTWARLFPTAPADAITWATDRVPYSLLPVYDNALFTSGKVSDVTTLPDYTRYMQDVAVQAEKLAAALTPHYLANNEVPETAMEIIARTPLYGYGHQLLVTEETRECEG